MVQWGVILHQLVYSLVNYHLCYKAKYVTFADDAYAVRTEVGN